MNHHPIKPIINPQNLVSTPKKSSKSFLVTLILQITLGIFGAGRFYVGQSGLGALRLSFTIFLPGIFGIIKGAIKLSDNGYTLVFSSIFVIITAFWWLYDLITLLSNKWRDKDGLVLTHCVHCDR